MHIPRKRFGQHFLTDNYYIEAIVSGFNPQQGEHVLEIGPGLGALTEPLLGRVSPLTVVELDRDLAARWRARYPVDKLTVIESDALRVDFSAVADGRPLRIIGNLPYNISTPLLFHLAEHVDMITDMHFMLQKEVVDRMVAAPSCADYGRLSVMLQYRFEMARLLAVPPEAFDPPPKVDSAVVCMVPRQHGLSPAVQACLAEVVQCAFAQRRKTLKNNLSSLFTMSVLQDLGIAPTARAESVSVADDIQLAMHLAAHGPK